MNTSSVRWLVIAVLLLVGLALFWSPKALSQINASPVWVPVGVASSGNFSTVWFHQPSTSTALACQTVAAQGAGITGIHCVAAKLP